MDIEIEIPGSGLAFDRRTYDADGRMAVTDCVISASQVNPYMGREVPDYQQLGLDPERMYRLFRDPVALKAATKLFDGLPLLIEHAAVSAADPKQHLIVGAISDCRWEDSKIFGTVSVWHADAIRGIEANLQRDLSAGYRYRPLMKAGTAPNGEPFDGRMLDIAPQHVALVPQGRVSGAMVGDKALARGASLTVDAALRAVRVAAKPSPLDQLIPGLNRLR